MGERVLIQLRVSMKKKSNTYKPKSKTNTTKKSIWEKAAVIIAGLGLIVLIIINRESIKKLFTISKPEIMVILNCDFSENKYSIYVKNLGDLEAKVNFSLKGWNSAPPENPLTNTEILRKNQVLNIVEFDTRSWVQPDSTVQLNLKISYGSENGSGDSLFSLLKKRDK